MTPLEFAIEMSKIKMEFSGDPEAVHSKMDDLMCETLGRLGYSDGVEVFHSVEKWYA